MKTTEIFVEQVFIGFVFLLIVCLPFQFEILQVMGRIETISPYAQIGIVGFVVGITYLVGIVFDRLADSMLGGLERHHRLRVALMDLDLSTDGGGADWPDPFPEDDFRVCALKRGGDFQAWLDYLRVRMRLTRSLAFFLPALTFSAVIALVRAQCLEGCSLLRHETLRTLFGMIEIEHGHLGVSSVAFLIVVYALVHAVFWTLGRVTTHFANQHRSYGYSGQPIELRWIFMDMWNPPRTNDVRARNYGQARKLTKPDGGKDKARWLAWDVVLSPLAVVGIVLAVVTLRCAQTLSPPSLAPAALAGFVLAGVAGWAWWRTADTYYSYLRKATD